ncbi:DUF2993 domain-containing protein [Streptomyces sp. NPDC092296]|uniref:LmeA family phospholipid-binding protein n=1 Tax=Streptomyces sp. NPDC092296 TaxID=3366012 RepID=UPI0038027A56
MRAWTKLLIALVILAGLFVAVDRIAVGVADSKVAERIQSHEHLNTKPHVSIEGFPFLTQVLSKKLDSVRLSADDLEISGGGHKATLRSFTAHISGVRVNSSFSSATADSAQGTALISYADLTSLLGQGATLSYAGDGKVKITGKVDTPLGKVDGSGTARLAVRKGNSITVGDVSVSALGGGIDLGSLPGGVGSALGSLLAPSLKLAGLPVGLSLESVQPQADGVSIGFTGHNLNLAG